ncbi:MarR family winged helix-turn-helix transcriptional regulator [Gordonia sp. CPCC 205515]|uniref:MarR family winged helix-turn-helix transcriptional regulator n=1 Tax=Gordonia sp. CPCC 205515 TaxID=3140791 RepID=UPI003AF40092
MLTRTTTERTPATPSRAATVHRDLIRIGRVVRARSGEQSLPEGQLSALWTIAEHAPIRASDLAEREGVAGPTMSRVVASLEKNAMVERATDPHDGRACLLKPSDDGLAYLRGSSSRKADVFDQALDHLDSSERDAVQRSVRLLADTLCQLDPSPTRSSKEEPDA